MTPEHDILQVTLRVGAAGGACRSNSRIDPALYRAADVGRSARHQWTGRTGWSDQHFDIISARR